MAGKLGKEQITTVEEITVSNAFEITALVNLLVQKGLLTREELIEEIERLHKTHA